MKKKSSFKTAGNVRRLNTATVVYKGLYNIHDHGFIFISGKLACVK